MKAKRILTAVCVGLSLILCIAIFTAIFQHPAQATIATGQPQFGNTELIISSSNSAASVPIWLNLSGSGATTAPSIPCYNMQLALLYSGTGATTTGEVLIGSASGAASTTYPVYSTPTSGTAGVQYFALPQVTNVNQVWVEVPFAAGVGGTTKATVEAIYTK
jgi:hypothetical protein